MTGRTCPPGCTCGRHKRAPYRPTCRRLRPGEPLPPGEPKRYDRGQRYVILRWRVGIGQYVEAPEHRIITGLPAGDVHHGNGIKHDNQPGNLHPLSHVDHARIHVGGLIEARRAIPVRFGTRPQVRAAKRARVQARKAARQRFLAEVVRLYKSGLTTVEVGAVVGRHHSSITRALQQAGVKVRGKQ